MDQRMASGILQKKVEADLMLATDGQEALKLMEQRPPDAILTDMQMPQMGGLELVERVQQEYPGIPTILMTAHGSEETAMLALQRGAASYVPKRFLAENLADAVHQVLSVTGLQAPQIRLKDFWERTHSRFRINNDDSLIPALVARVRKNEEADVVRVGVALHEALRNAMHHGNLELDSELRREDPQEYYRMATIRRQASPYHERRVTVTADETPEESKYVILDEGPGFDTSAVHYNPEDPADLAKNSGRGLFLIKTFMSEVKFNEAGNEITMIHRRQRDAGPSQNGKRE